MQNLLESFFRKIFKGSHRSYQAKKHILYSFTFKGISLIVGLLYVPLLIDFLDKERYGIWLTISSVLLWFNFFDIGLGNGLRNKLVESFAKGDNVLARKYISTAYSIITIIFISLFILFFIVNPFLNWQELLNTKIISRKELYYLSTIVFSFFIFRFILQIVGNIYLAAQKPAINNIISPISNVLALGIIFLLLKFDIDGKLIILGIIVSGTPVFVYLIFTIITFKGKYKNISPSIKYIDLGLSKGLLGLGFKFFLLQITSIVLFSTSNIIISQVFEPEDVAIYNVIFRFFQIPIMLYNIVNLPIWSAVTDAYIRKDFIWLKSTLKKMNYLSFLFVFFIIIMIIFHPIAFQFWLKNRIEIPAKLVYSMGLYAIINVLVAPFSSYINGFGKLKLSNYLVILSVILYIPLAIFLAKTTNGSYGVILSTCVINSIGLITLPIQVKKIICKNDYGIWGK